MCISKCFSKFFMQILTIGVNNSHNSYDNFSDDNYSYDIYSFGKQYFNEKEQASI